MNLRTISAGRLYLPGMCPSLNTHGISPFLRAPTKKSLPSRSSAPIYPKALVAGLAPEPLNQVLSALAHEVRNPLTNINLSVDMLTTDLKDDEQKIYLDIIRRSSIRINDLFTRLLKYQDALKEQAESNSIHQLLEEVLDITRDRITLKNILVKKEFASEDFRMVVNKPEIKMALTNIIINAIEAMIPGKGQLILTTSFIGGKYKLRIEDNGCGISRGNLGNIFKPFFTSRPGGLGLGLSTAYNALCSNHILTNVESEEGVGTSFILLFDQEMTGEMGSVFKCSPGC